MGLGGIGSVKSKGWRGTRNPVDVKWNKFEKDPGLFQVFSILGSVLFVINPSLAADDPAMDLRFGLTNIVIPCIEIPGIVVPDPDKECTTLPSVDIPELPIAVIDLPEVTLPEVVERAFELTTNQVAAVSQLISACVGALPDNSAATDLLQLCQLVNSFDATDPVDAASLKRLLEAFSPEEAYSIVDSIVYASGYQATNIYARLNSLRSGLSQANLAAASALHGSGGFSGIPPTMYAGVNRASSEEHAAEDIESGSRLGVFVNAQLSSGELEGGLLEQDAETSATNLTAGMDYRMSDAIVVGAGVGFLQSKTDFSSVLGSTTADGTNLTLFGSWYQQNKAYIDVVLDYGLNRYELERSIGITPGVQIFAAGDTEASVLSFTLGVGRNFNRNRWDLGTYARFSYTDASIDAYTESASATGLGSSSIYSVSKQAVASTRLSLGGQLSRTISTRRAVLIPTVKLEVETERETDKEDLEVTLLVTDTAQSYQGNERDASYALLGIGGSAVFPNGKSAYLFYETRLAHELVSQDWLKLGFRMEF